MWKRNGKHLAPKSCRHRKTRTSSAGLMRVVCDTCGHVSVRYLGAAVIEDDIYIPNEAQPETG